MNKAHIEKEAKEILDRFANALEKVEKESATNEEIISLHNRESTRQEKEGKKSPSDFKERFLKNAPKKNNQGIIAEKGDWK